MVSAAVKLSVPKFTDNRPESTDNGPVQSPRVLFGLCEGAPPERTVSVFGSPVEWQPIAPDSPVQVGSYAIDDRFKAARGSGLDQKLAQSHMDGLIAAGGQTNMVPFRYRKLIIGTEALSRFWQNDKDALMDRLIRIRGCAEFSLKIYAEGLEPISKPPNGFPARMRDKFRALGLSQLQIEVADLVLKGLLDQCRETQSLPVRPNQGQNAKNLEIMHFACLVKHTKAEKLATITQKLTPILEQCGLGLVLRGPLPCFVFTIERKARD